MDDKLYSPKLSYYFTFSLVKQNFCLVWISHSAFLLIGFTFFYFKFSNTCHIVLSTFITLDQNFISSYLDNQPDCIQCFCLPNSLLRYNQPCKFFKIDCSKMYILLRTRKKSKCEGLKISGKKEIQCKAELEMGAAIQYTDIWIRPWWIDKHLFGVEWRTKRIGRDGDEEEKNGETKKKMWTSLTWLLFSSCFFAKRLLNLS